MNSNRYDVVTIGAGKGHSTSNSAIIHSGHGPRILEGAKRLVPMVSPRGVIATFAGLRATGNDL